MIQATINVGGIVLNALAIEHFILRHPADSERVSEDVLTNVTVKFMFNQGKKKKGTIDLRSFLDHNDNSSSLLHELTKFPRNLRDKIRL